MSKDPHGLAAVYALDAIDDLERASYERHLQTCDRCQSEVASFDDAILTLVGAAPPVPPPASLKADLMQQITTVPQRPSHRRSWWTHSRVLLAAAVVAVLAVAGVTVTEPWVQPVPVASLAPAERVLLAPDAQERVARIGAAQVVVTTSRSEAAATLQAKNLPVAPAGRAYQVWFIDPAGSPRSAGLISGSGPQLLSGRPGAVLAITLEPAGGSRAPTTTPLTTVPLT